jgi:SGNH domain (fused to AT3 domains)
MPRPTTTRLTVALLLTGAAALGVAATAPAQDRGRIARTSADPLAAKPACFGAAGRDPARSCREPRDRLSVVPSPRKARDLPPAACATRESEGRVSICSFGTDPAAATDTIALVGDSHAAQWRAALEPVAQAKRWRGLSMMHSGCPLSKALRALSPPSRRRSCGAWKGEVFAWFARHPEVHTVFVGGLSGGSGVVPERGRSEFDTSAAGYRAAWNALPPSVTRIVVLRDTPKMRGGVNGCVQRAIRARTPAGVRCAVSRSSALDPDPILAAARETRSRRTSIVDLTRFFCDRARCYPVIGGVLAFKDSTHLTPVFAETLAPFLLRAVTKNLAARR